ncbi:GSCOCT00012099001.2-RA-CDS [Cotesia congregata]|uniref:TNF receptor-associated factor 6_Cc n=1 Tax=Cotesia congregata TaxID=51543 RepID=A0A8J2HTH5_COTCN|nr:GSCOCT00012099001.2-RA-CDS [Cotesia congregata]CAG5108233.1 TNF receptor-associated factor 6_Cc [Cotesia congregata]
MECVFKDGVQENHAYHYNIDGHVDNTVDGKYNCSTFTDGDINNCSLENARSSLLQVNANEKYEAFTKSALSDSSQSLEVDFEKITDWKKLIKNLYERIVTLEQLNQELHITITNQCADIESLQKNINLKEFYSRNCSGMYIWKIISFEKKLNEMKLNSSTMFYSPEFFTHPNGYKMCARINISSKNSQFLSIVIHMMQSENDNYLDWPFNGTISFILIHQKDSKKSIREETHTKPNVEAFKKPVGEINRRSFGYTEFVSLDDLSNYLFDNSLVFRIEVTKTKIPMT